ncbi:MAG: TRAP transporter small permease [Desulfobacterales bacterium]|nr:MAG: TRAP transporter small permease [Desulfobacterales bacterium]
MGWIDKLSSHVDKSIHGVMALLMSLMVIDVLFGVLNRFLLKYPISWTEEVARFLMIWICMLGATIAIKKGTHVAVIYFVTKFSAKAKNRLALINHILIIAFLLIPSIYGIKLCVSQMGQLSPALRISMFWPFLAVPAGCIIMILHEVVLIRRT